MNELEAVTARHPRFVTPKGDSRERHVPCSCCGRPTLALSPLLCGRCLPISTDSSRGEAGDRKASDLVERDTPSARPGVDLRGVPHLPATHRTHEKNARTGGSRSGA